MTESKSAQVNRKKDRPLGLWLLTISDGLFSGLAPFIAVVILYQNPESQLTTLDFIITVLICGGIMASAIGASYLDNFSRFTLLTLMTIYWALLFFNSVSLIKADAVNKDNWGVVYGDLWRPIFWVGINWWYMLRRRTRELYRSGDDASARSSVSV